MYLESLHTTKAVAIILINLLLVFLKSASFLDSVNKCLTNVSKRNFSLLTTLVKGYFFIWGQTKTF
jgi:hypothetical protein